jgi:hypothetical protein
MTAQNLDLVDALLRRPDLGPAALDLAADLLREAPAPPGCLVDVRGGHEAMADIFNAVACLWRGTSVASALHVLPVALECWLSALTPGLIVADARGGESLARNRRHFAALFGPEAAEAFLSWIHAYRLYLEMEVSHGEPR